MKQHVKIGVVCLARDTYDFAAAAEIYGKIKEDLKNIEQVTYSFIDDLVISVEDARKAADYLASKNVDGLVVISGTFHLGHLVLELNKEIKKPIYLWGLNELPYNGGKIRLNSVCGVNLNASNLYKSGNRQYYASVGDTIDENWINAIRIDAALKNAYIGIAGFRAHGFFNLGIDELNSFNEMGLILDHFELSEIFDTKVSEEEINDKLTKLKNNFDSSDINEYQLNKVAELAAKLKKFVDTKGLTGLAIRCWPEFAATFGVSPCAAMSLLQSEDYILGCEGDIEGTLSMIAQRAIGGETPFLADLSQVDFAGNFALMWHCGVAPCNLWDGKCVRSLDTYFAGGRGVTAGFVMKAGEVTFSRIDSAQGKIRLFMQKGKAVPMEKQLAGTYAKVIFENSVTDVVNKVIYTGVAHHVSMVYGDYIRPFEIFASIKGWEIIR